MTYTPERLREMAAVMLAAAEGKKIECKYDGREWHSIDESLWNWHIYDYRVKREPIEIEMWVYPATGLVSPKNFVPGEDAILRKFREVIEP